MGIFFLHPQCECEAPFVQHLKDALMLVEDALIKEHIDEIANILENLEVLPTVKVRLLL